VNTCRSIPVHLRILTPEVRFEKRVAIFATNPDLAKTPRPGQGKIVTR
jgi:hypothetical protein